MRNIRKISIKNYQYYTFNNKINIKTFDPNLLSIDKISFKNADGVIYNTKYITMKSLNSENIDSGNPRYIIFNNVDGYIIGKSNRHKYLVFASTKDNKKFLRTCTKIWGEIKNQIETINRGKSIKNKKRFHKNQILFR